MKVVDSFCLNDKYSTTRLVTKEKPIIEKNPNDKFETVLFLPTIEGRKGEGGLRTQGYFKTSLPDKPLITVITVVFNGAEHLEETILSVINQSYDNVEYIIIDGGSNDRTLDIIKKYEGAIDYWVSEPDKGIYDAMNKGLKNCNGDFLLFLNAADTFTNNSVLAKVTVKIRDKNKAYFGRANINGIDTNWLFPPLKISSLEEADIWSKKYLPNHQSIFFPYCFYSSNQYDTDFKICGDTEYKLRYIKNHHNFLFIDTVICNFKLGGISNKIDKFKNVKTQCQEQIKLLKIYHSDSFHYKKYFIILKFLSKYILAKLTFEKYYQRFLLLANKLRV